jgi:hypothetical protein
MDVLLSHQCRREITLGRSVAVCTHSLELHDIVSTIQGDQCRTVGMLLMRAQPEVSRTLVLRIGGCQLVIGSPHNCASGSIGALYVGFCSRGLTA